VFEAIIGDFIPTAWLIADFDTVLAGVALVMGLLSLGLYHRVRRDRQRFVTALNHMSQGLCVFDANARLILCNNRYLEMYGMSAAVVTPGCSLRDILEHRQETGSFTGDIDDYLANVFNELAHAEQITKVLQLPDGRKIALTERAMPGGGWVVTHDDVSEQSRLEQRAAALRINEQRRGSIEAAINAFRDQVQSVLRAVGENATTMKSTATALFGISNQTSQHVEGAVASSKEASANVTSAASAADELAGSITEISRQITSTTDIVRETARETQAASQGIIGLAQSAQQIGDIVKLIQSVAGQTNLLALNATIEAARAGEFGRGFAVVASEVKSLAVQTAKATEAIAGQILAVQGATNDTVDAIHRITQRMDDVEHRAATVAAAVEEQNAATAEIAQGVTSAARGTSQAVAVLDSAIMATDETRTAVQTVLSNAESVEAAVHELRSKIETFLKQVAV